MWEIRADDRRQRSLRHAAAARRRGPRRRESPSRSASTARVHDPSRQLIFTLFFSSTISMKVWLGTLAVVLGLRPGHFSALSIYGRLPGRRAVARVVHRISGGSRSFSRCPSPTTACGHLGSRTPTGACSRTRSLGCVFYGAFAAKVTLVRSKGLPRGRASDRRRAHVRPARGRVVHERVLVHRRAEAGRARLEARSAERRQGIMAAMASWLTAAVLVVMLFAGPAVDRRTTRSSHVAWPPTSEVEATVYGEGAEGADGANFKALFTMTLRLLPHACRPRARAGSRVRRSTTPASTRRRSRRPSAAAPAACPRSATRSAARTSMRLRRTSRRRPAVDAARLERRRPTSGSRRRWRRWGARCSTGSSCAATRRVLDAGCGTGRVTAALLERLPRGEVVAVDGVAGDGRGGARAARPARRACSRADLLELDARRAGRRDPLDRDVPLDPRPRPAVRAAARGAAAGRAARRPVRRRRQRRRRSQAAIDAVADARAGRLGGAVERSPRRRRPTARLERSRVRRRARRGCSRSASSPRTRASTSPRSCSARTWSGCRRTRRDAVRRRRRSPSCPSPAVEYVRLNITARRADAS